MRAYKDEKDEMTWDKNPRYYYGFRSYCTCVRWLGMMGKANIRPWCWASCPNCLGHGVGPIRMEELR